MAEIAANLVIDRLVPLLTSEINLLGHLHEDFSSIKDELESVRSFLKDAESKLDSREKANTDSSLETWVKQVREVAFRIEDVINEYTFLVEKHDKHGCFCKLVSLAKKPIAQRQISSKIQDIETALQKISERRKRYDLSSTEPQRGSGEISYVSRNRFEPLFITKDEVVGIESSKDELISKLFEQTTQNYVLSVVGMGGIGKTTVVKKIYDDQRVLEHFNCRIWIAISQSYKKEDLLRKIVNQLLYKDGNSIPEGVTDKMDSLSLIEKIRDLLAEKRYMVVVDDVWEVDFWGEVKHAFPENNKGSRIMITTRSKDVALASGTSSFQFIYSLPFLSHDKAFDLFCKKVFQSHEGTCPQELLQLSHRLTNMCGGLPLAISTIGGLLATKEKTVDVFTKFCQLLEVGSSNADQRLTTLISILSQSYHDLPYQLKACFLYLGRFPDDSSIDSSKLIKLWLAEGFVKHVPHITAEDVAEGYLNELIQRSLIQVEDRRDEYSSIHIHMRIRVHDMMRNCIIVPRSTEINLHHTTIESCAKYKKIGRRLVICEEIKDSETESFGKSFEPQSIAFYGRYTLSGSTVTSIFVQLKLLKVLDLEGAEDLKNIPNELGNLLQLTYLSLRGTNVSTLPKSIGKLRKLETLDLRITFVRQLPVPVNSFPKLRNLSAYSVRGVVLHRGIKIEGCIMRLKEIRELYDIEVDDNKSFINELPRLTQLRKLGITSLRSEDALGLYSALEKLTNIRELSIGGSLNNEEQLELHSISHSPPPLLEHLWLRGPLANFPSWISQAKNLVFIRIEFSRLEEDDSRVLQNLPNLLELSLCETLVGERLHINKGCFGKLRRLYLGDLKELKVLEIEEGALPLLEELHIWRCPQFEKVPTGIQLCQKLKRLNFHDVKREVICSMMLGGDSHWMIKHIPAVEISVKAVSGKTAVGYTYHSIREDGFREWWLKRATKSDPWVKD